MKVISPSFEKESTTFDSGFSLRVFITFSKFCFLFLSIHVQTQQQKNKVRIGGLLCGRVTGGSSGAGLVIAYFAKFLVGFK